MKKKFIVIMIGLLLILVPDTALSQLSPPFRPLPFPTTSAIQKYSSEQLKFSFNYPQGWRVKEEQGTVNVENLQGFAWITIWRIDENVDPQTFEQPEQPTETAQPSGDGSEGIKILRDSARRADPLPLPQRTPPKDWVHFAHPTIFTLKLIRPPDWKEEVMQDPSGYYGGLKIISPDEQANLFVYYQVVFGAVTLEEAIREGIYLLTGSESQVEVLVEDDLRKVVSAIWPGVECLFVAFRSQGKVGVFLSITCPLGQGAAAATSVQLKGCIGPADKFDNLVKEVFYKVFGWVGAGGYTTPVPRG